MLLYSNKFKAHWCRKVKSVGLGTGCTLESPVVFYKKISYTRALLGTIKSECLQISLGIAVLIGDCNMQLALNSRLNNDSRECMKKKPGVM